jgi:hypothetical protein
VNERDNLLAVHELCIKMKGQVLGNERHRNLQLLFARHARRRTPVKPALSVCQALDAGSTAALPDSVRAELEQLEDCGGAGYLSEVSGQVRVGQPIPLTALLATEMCHKTRSSSGL